MNNAKNCKKIEIILNKRSKWQEFDWFALLEYSEQNLSNLEAAWNYIRDQSPRTEFRLKERRRRKPFICRFGGKSNTVRASIYAGLTGDRIFKFNFTVCSRKYSNKSNRWSGSLSLMFTFFYILFVFLFFIWSRWKWTV